LIGERVLAGEELGFAVRELLDELALLPWLVTEVRQICR